MQITINGQPESCTAGLSVRDLLGRLDLPVKNIAVERNREIVPRPAFADTRLKEGDCIEIVHFVGGG